MVDVIVREVEYVEAGLSSYYLETQLTSDSSSNESPNDEDQVRAATEVTIPAVYHDSTSAFQSLANISSDLLPTEMQLTKFAAHFVRFSSGTQWFDWDGFSQAIQDYNLKENDLVLLPPPTGNEASMTVPVEGHNGGYSFHSNEGSTLGRTLVRRDSDELSAVSDITNWIVYVITKGVGISMDAGAPGLGVSVNTEAIYDTVLNTFTSLKWAGESGFADFSSSSTGMNSSWEYRITFSSPHPDSPNDFLSFVCTISLHADITNESSWWGLESSSRKCFGCDIFGYKFKVTKGFKDPGDPSDDTSHIVV
ncbi:delta-endotoxin CytB [Lentinula edodes]|uniref:Delta-endotoxin CytB n=1 Tax=Lentinula lateritia TaxID=40482 RepID=A0A9W9AV17_9AGAR|nr:delta-endotoxin CytB [Lentinula edodes]